MKTRTTDPRNSRKRPLPLAATATGATLRDSGPKKQKRKSVPFTAEELRAISREISDRAIPETGTTRLELMEIDPWNIYAHWHINESDMEKCKRKLADKALTAKLVLRLSDITSRREGGDSHEAFDIDVGASCNNWYVSLWRDFKHYSSEIGLKTTDGMYATLARSNEVSTPSAGPSSNLDFIPVEVRAPHFVEQPPSIEPERSKYDLLKNLFPQRRLPQNEFPLASEEILLTPANKTKPVSANASDEQVVTTDQHLSFPVVPQIELDKYGTQAKKAKKKINARDKLPLLEPPAEGMVAPANFVLATHPLPALDNLAQAGATAETTSNPSGISVVGFDLVSGQEGERLPSVIHLEALLGRAGSSFFASDNSINITSTLNIQGTCPPGSRLVCFGEPIPVNAEGNFSVTLSVESGPELVELLYRGLGRLTKY